MRGIVDWTEMTPEEEAELASRVARTCQACMGFGGHGIVRTKGTAHEQWSECSACGGTGARHSYKHGKT